MESPKETRIIDEKLLQKIRELPCIVCSRPGPSDPAHIQSRGSGGDDVEWNLIPLCRRDHSSQHSLGWDRFCEKFPSVRRALEKRGWVIINGRLRRKE